MTQQLINVGTTPNDGTGESSRAGFIKINNNFTDLYTNLKFLLLLEQNGAVFNGTTDDSAAIINSIAAYTHSNRGKIVFPANLQIKINNPLTIVAGITAVDFNGCVIDASGISAGVGTILPDGNTVYPTIFIVPDATTSGGLLAFGGYEYSNPIQNLTLLGPNSNINNLDGIFVGRLSGNGQISGLRLSNIHILGFRQNIYMGDFVYVNTLDNFSTSTAWQYGFNLVCKTTSGENIYWNGGVVSGCVNGAVTVGGNTTAGTSCGINMPATNGGFRELHMQGVSLDYNDLEASILEGALFMSGCHLEDRNINNPFFNISQSAGSSNCTVTVVGCSFNPTETTARSSLINISGGYRAKFLSSGSRWNTYSKTSTIVNVTSGNPQVGLAGSYIDYNGVSTVNYPTISPYLNAIPNPGFELGNLNGWTHGSNYTFSNVTTPVQAGTYAAQMVSSSASTNDGLYVVIPCRPGKSIYIRAYLSVTAISAGNARIVFSFYDITQTIVIATTIVINPSTVSSGFIVAVLGAQAVPAGAAYAQLGMFGNAFVGTAQLDSCELYII